MFAKACEIFVLELSMLSWNHTEENKRRTLQRNDIVTAVSKNDTYDFLIDIVPREGAKVSKKVPCHPVTLSPCHHAATPPRHLVILAPP